MAREINTVDLFCGAGGATTGLELALARRGMTHRGIAINHWSIAVDTMQKNHPLIDTKCMTIEEAVPSELVPGGVVDLLWASPSCTHHSRAKGGKPRDKQLRAQPDLILSWLDQLFVRRLIVENVPEFVEWGPLGLNKKPIKRKKGASFHAWVKAIEARNYKVEWRIVNCADYGDATTRRRFFLKAVRIGCGKIRWPEPTHAEHPQPDLFGRMLKPWRGVRECLDLNDLGRSIFNRDRPLAENTLRRIAVGMKKFNGIEFTMDMLGAGENHASRVHSLDEPLVTQPAGGNRTAIVKPFIVRMNRNCTAEDVESPLSTTTTKEHHALCSPIVIDHFRNGEAQDGTKPIGAQTTHDRYSVVQAFVVKMNNHATVEDIEKPLTTVTTSGTHHLLCQPLILGQNGGATARPATEPCPTIATAGAIRVATPVILDMSRPGGCDSGHVRSADQPLQTLTTCDAVQGCFPVLADGRVVDIRIRMLKPSELAAAHSFPKDYVLTGNRSEQVKQIGNSVPVETAAAMCGVEFEGVAA